MTRPTMPRTWRVETPLGPVAVWDSALQARGYPVDTAGATALAHDLIDADENENGNEHEHRIDP